MNTVKIVLPPLRDRNEDIPYLVEHFIRKFRARFSKQISGVENEVLRIFYNYSFPGNIRELEKIIEYAFIICEKEKIGTVHLPEEILRPKIKIQPEPKSSAPLPENEQIISLLSEYLSRANNTTKKYHTNSLTDEEEKNLIIETINKNNGNKTHAARELNMHYTTLWKKIKKYNIL
jgi:transcriptional regulator with PAS, ATPase and Fis domain